MRSARAPGPVDDLAMSRWFGPFVVGRLAQDHGVEVRLAPTPPHGITARVLVPVALLASPGAPGPLATSVPALAPGAAHPPAPVGAEA